MKILLCGKFDPSYNRTRILIEGFRQSGIDLSIFTYPRKRKADIKKLKKVLEDTDYIFLPSFTHTDLPFIRRLSSKPIIFDPLISRYLSKVFDYKTISKYSIRAYKNYLKDSRSLKKADLIISDTLSHKHYFMEKFKVPAEKIKVVPIGVIKNDFFPININKRNTPKLVVGFYGSFIPLHGIDIVLKAAGILKNDHQIIFRLIGDGILMKEMVMLAKTLELSNVEFVGWKKYEELNEEINKFDIALGIFGSSIKASMVIPNKIYHYSAAGKAVITMKSDAINEVFSDNINILLCDNKEDSLADAILKLKDEKLRENLGTKAHQLVVNEYNELKIAGLVIEFIKNQSKGIGA